MNLNVPYLHFAGALVLARDNLTTSRLRAAGFKSNTDKGNQKEVTQAVGKVFKRD